MQECFTIDSKELLVADESFLVQCITLVQQSLDDNNIQIYLIALEALSKLIQSIGTSDVVLDALPSLLQIVILRTTDTNTRVRKRSVEIVNQVWSLPPNSKTDRSSQQLIAEILCDP